ncbi:MAG: hypothetical protein B7Z75_08485 [Acidocella sp. 20-57-95]|nr:MAG: hypothetical protein B7Z75_08485 [Acidocella sp. 20-57-95]OYV59483.1 MAG: hypothetical protein B7Z71_07980 [Acidocella sp. 21-58-7]HQT64896.1 serpin family protein [Acidocella sp.]HQU04891.1 serpin family protein [Acidocella sp.]
MKISLPAFAWLAAAWLPGYAAAQPALPLTQPEIATATDLYGKLRAQPGNLFFSPYSITTAMGMVLAGAKGDTASQIASALHLSALAPAGDIAGLQKAFLQDAQAQPVLGGAASGGFTLHAANALWGQTGYKFSPAYISSIKASFGGNLQTVDFTNEAAARARINQWVADATANKIPDLIGPGVLTKDTRLVLTNAVYFNAKWETPFKPENTVKKSFYVTATDDVQTDLMSMTKNFNLTQSPAEKILIMPYLGGDASMVVILPNDPNGLNAVEAGLTAAQVQAWIAGSKPTLVDVALPKFKTTGAFDLNAVLKTLGISKAFDPTAADFSLLANDPEHPLYIGSVIHQAFITVDETATEAAAATAVTMFAATAMAPMEPAIQPVPFIADHPFLYLIMDNSTGQILFMGRETNPAE